jgi:Tfp pilus assembly PilM family ATPase
MDLKELSKMDLGSLLKGGSKKPADVRMSSVLGLEIGSDELRAIRLKSIKDQVEIVAADCFPLPEEGALASSVIPPAFRARYTALAISSPESDVRVFSHTEDKVFDLQKVLRQNLSSGEEDRVDGKVLKEQRKERTILGVSVPSSQIEDLLEVFSEGPPAIRSVELAGLAPASLLNLQKGAPFRGEAVCLIEGGHDEMVASFFSGGQLMVVNRFSTGMRRLLHEIAKEIDVNEETAMDIACGSGIDISHLVTGVFGSSMKKMAIAGEFVARQSRTSLARCYLAGPLALSSSWASALQTALGVSSVDAINPFDLLKKPEEGIEEDIEKKGPLFAAAAGAALSALHPGAGETS